MYIVAIAWMYVVVLMAATQNTVLAGLGTLVFYGVVPCGVVMYIIMAPTRAKRKKALEALETQQKQQNPQDASANSAPPTSQTVP
jgi:predicted membrane channel-forming protein YqfA (hemolysin III family)